MEPRKNKYTNYRERVLGLLYVLLLFMLCSGSCLYYLFRSDENRRLFSHKGNAVAKMERLTSFRRVQVKYLPQIDTLCQRIDHFIPSVTATYEQSEIDILIRELAELYEQNSFDSRYKVFLHSSDLCRMWFNDKKELWGLRENIKSFRQNLEACEIGLQRKTDELKQTKK